MRRLPTSSCPRYRADALPEESRLEAAYRTDIVTEYKYSELIGLNLPAELRRQPVRVAYMRYVRRRRTRRRTPTGAPRPLTGTP